MAEKKDEEPSKEEEERAIAEAARRAYNLNKKQNKPTS